MNDLHLVPCTPERHAGAILDIFNHAIATSTALYDYHPRPPEQMAAWFASKHTGNLPVLGLEDAAGTLQGFASYGPFRPQPAYKYTMEHSVYVHPEHRGKGLGKILMQELITRARLANVHTLVGCIDASNAGSIHLHQSLGFTHAGTFKEVGFKFGRWLDVAFYLLTLDTPAEPVDG